MPRFLLTERLLHSKVVFHMLIAIVGLISVLLHILFSPAPFVSMTKFTIHSNIIVSLTFTASALFILIKKKENQLLDLSKNAALIYMFVTFFTYHFLLSSGGEYSGLRIMTNFNLHYLIPLF
ncbi:Pr6Pr family membrane protein [Bacillus sp. Bva_UNVM-123]